jgi:hypothetical protein
VAGQIKLQTYFLTFFVWFFPHPTRPHNAVDKKTQGIDNPGL